MAANTSNASVLPPPLPLSSSTLYSFLHFCFSSTTGFIHVTVLSFTSLLLLLPLYIFILYLGLQRWRRRPGSTMTHSDVFTYHMMAFEMMQVFGCLLTSCGVFADVEPMMEFGFHFFIVNYFGQLWFHPLTCVDRYLAVVHPVVYLNLKKEKGVRIRNVACSCVWLLCGAATNLLKIRSLFFNTFAFCSIVFNLSVVSFCSLSVLYVLIRPGPGEGGGARQRVDQLKLRAFHTISIILGVLLLKFGGSLLTLGVYIFLQTNQDFQCSVMVAVVWINQPGDLVLPLLLLHRAGKLPCLKNSSGARQGPE
ncbi:uncharacterized protein V6R79_006414 [Siganus canaliculatus]